MNMKNNEKLWLAIVAKDGNMLEKTILTSNVECYNSIVPKRKCFNTKYGKTWIIPFDKRRKFGGIANKKIEELGSNEDILSGYFCIVGIGSRWADVVDVDWCLIVSEDL